MPGNRSLDEFGAGADGSAEPGTPADADGPRAASGAEPEAGDGAEPADSGEESVVEPLAETFAWSPAAGSCARCGAAVEDRWRDGGELVCADCKAW
ncbi:MAG: hypothetical protein ABEJ92_01305 [Halobacteriales archaeon]